MPSASSSTTRPASSAGSSAASSAESSLGSAPPVLGGQMPLIEHLRELRRRLAVAALALVVGVVVAFLFWEPVFDVLREPYCRTPQGTRNCDLFSVGLFDQFRVRLQVALIGGVLLSSPVWLYELGAFVTPALHRQERRYALGFLVASTAFFSLGCFFAFLTVNQGLEFLLTIGGRHVVTLLSVQSYLSFVTLCLVAFGIAFEFPVFVLFLHLVGALPAERMRRWRRGTVIGIAVASAVITPSQDPVTFLAMAVPLYLLYEVCILVARLHERAVRRRVRDDVPDDVASPLSPAAPA